MIKKIQDEDTYKLFDEQGYIDLDKIQYKEIEIPIDKNASSAKKWIEIEGKKILVKRDEDFSESTQISQKEQQIEIYNNIIIEEILEQMGIEHAEYYLGKKQGKTYILTPSFLKEGEKIVTGESIIEAEDDRIIETQLEAIEKYLKSKGLKTEQIEELKKEHLQQIFLSKALGIIDFHTGNWGFIEDKNGKVIKTQPFTDFDITNTEDKENDYSNILENGKDDIKSFIEKYEEYAQLQEIIDKFSKLDRKSIFQNSYKKTHIKIREQDIQEYYYNYIERLKQIGKEQKLYGRNKEDE